MAAMSKLIMPEIDVRPHLEQGQRPSAIFKLAPGEVWQIAQASAISAPPDSWISTSQGDYFYVPLTSYAIEDLSAEALLLALPRMIQALLVSTELPQPILRLCLPVGGLQQHPERSGVLVFWLGCAVCVAQ